MKKVFLCILSAICFLSCKDEYTICDLPTAVRMNCRFYQLVNGVQNEAVVSFLTVTQLSFPSPDYASPGLSEFSLALNPVIDSVQYTISIRDASIRDTLTFVYTTRLINVSPVCGDVYINSLSRVSTTINTLDSISIVNSAVNTTPVENVRIYF